MQTSKKQREHSRGSSPLLLLVLTAALSACAGDPPEAPIRTISPSGSSTAPSARAAADRDRALVRVVATIPGASRLDLFAEGQKIMGALEYKTVTPYLDVPAGRQTLRLRPTGLETSDPLAEATHALDAGRHYTVLVMPGEENGPAAALRVFDDQMDPPDESQATLRVLHAASDAGRIDVSFQGSSEPLVSGLEFQRASDTVDVTPPAGALEVRPAQRPETMLRAANATFSAGGMYTIVLIGRTRIEPPLETLTIEDRIARQ